MFLYSKLIRATRISSLLLTSVLLVACGGGGGGDGGSSSITVSGTATAPGGAVAHLQSKTLFASILDTLIPSVNATLSGTSPVSGATVDLIRVDANGNQVGDVIASATTDDTGAYSIETSETPSSTLVVRIDSGSAVMRAIVTASGTDINPATEYVLSVIEAAIAANAGLDLTDFTVDEIQNLVDAVDAIAIDVTGTTISDALMAISVQASAAVDQEMSIATLDLTGTWYYEEYTGPNNCGYPQNIFWDSATFDIVQTGNSITASVEGQVIATGQLDGLSIINLPLESYPEEGGTVTETSQTFTVAMGGNSVSGSINWTWTSGIDSCSGSNSVTITRLMNG